MSDQNEVDQTGASADGHIVGRDQTNIVYNYRPSPVDELLRALANEQLSGTLFSGKDALLEYFETPVSTDGIIGLEAKLEHAGRLAQQKRAIREKELFVKLLEHWSHYQSAQKIFAIILSKIEKLFNIEIYPKLASLTKEQFDLEVYNLIVVPVAKEIGAHPMGMNEAVASGMLYWLAEKCYVKWH